MVLAIKRVGSVTIILCEMQAEYYLLSMVSCLMLNRLQFKVFIHRQNFQECRSAQTTSFISQLSYQTMAPFQSIEPPLPPRPPDLTYY